MPVRRGFSAPGVPRRLPGLVALARLAAVVAAFVPGALACFLPVLRCLVPGLWAACCFCAWPGLVCAAGACLPFARRALVCARIFLLSFAFSCLTFFSQNSFHLSLRPRRASTFFRKESRQRFARGCAPSNPIPAPCGQSSPLPRCWPAYAAFQAANRRLAGKRLKSQGAKLSFSSVSVQRGTPAPFR